MKLILQETVENLGEPGDLVEVKRGFGRNYLLPKGLAVVATAANERLVETLWIFDPGLSHVRTPSTTAPDERSHLPHDGVGSNSNW